MDLNKTSNALSDKKKACVLVCSCDAYEDAWVPFFSLFEKYWGDCPYDIYLNTETKSFSWGGMNIKCLAPYKNLSPQKTSKISYGQRMLDTLAMISSEYIILLLDDYFLRRKVSNDKIRKIISWMDEDESIATFNMRYSYFDYDIKSDKYEGFRLADNYSDFKQNMMAGIWRKDVFEKSWKKYESQWEWEAYGTIRTFDNGLKYYFSDYKNKYDPLFDFFDPEQAESFGITMGKWTPHAIKVIEENKIPCNFDNRGVIDSVNGKVPVSKYTGKNYLSKVLICFNVKSIMHLFRSAGLKWLLRYIKWKLFLFGHKQEEALYFIEWCKLKGFVAD